VQRVDHLIAVSGCSRGKLVKAGELIKVRDCAERGVVLEDALADEICHEGRRRVRHVGDECRCCCLGRVECLWWVDDGNDRVGGWATYEVPD